jgi:hypothetical protein
MPETPGPKIILGDDWKRREEPATGPANQPPVPTGGPPATGAGSSGLEVDSDWKRQAQAEKERLASQETKASGLHSKGSRGRRELPPADFQGLMETMVAQALLYLGAIPDPTTGRAIVSLEHARYQIDLLGVLEQKTKGNLSEEESKILAETLTALRMQYVEVSKVVAEMMAEQRAKSASGGGPAAGLGGGPVVGGLK